MGTLSESERKRIIETIRSLTLKNEESSTSPDAKSICHNCGCAKPLLGTVYYGQYRLCNDCALSYELANAQGDVKDIEEFILDE